MFRVCVYNKVEQKRNDSRWVDADDEQSGPKALQINIKMKNILEKKKQLYSLSLSSERCGCCEVRWSKHRRLQLRRMPHFTFWRCHHPYPAVEAMSGDGRVAAMRCCGRELRVFMTEHAQQRMIIWHLGEATKNSTGASFACHVC